MRIAVDVTPLAGPQTGIGRFVSYLTEGLQQQPDIELVGLAMTARGRDVIADVLGHSVTLSRPMPARLVRELWSRLSWPTAELLTGPVDLVHGTNYVVPPTKNAPALVSVHDLSAWHDENLVHKSSRAYPRLVEQALTRGAHVHAISAHVGAEIQDELGVPDERLHVVHLGVTPGPKPIVGAGRKLAGGRPYLLAVGTIEPRKDFPMLIDALVEVTARFPDVCLVIAGGSGWGDEDLNAAIHRSDMGAHVRLVGFVSDQQKADLLAEAELVVSSARYEGFGFVPLEAMAAATPVVAVAGGAIPEICGAAASLVPVGEPEALSSALCDVLGDSELRCQLIEAGLSRAEHFTRARSVQEMASVYRQIAAG